MKNDKINRGGVRHDISMKSKAVHQHAIHKPMVQVRPPARKIGNSMDIARSKSVTHFAPRPSLTPVAKPISTPKKFDIGTAKSPLVNKIPAQPVIINSPKAIKEAAIAEATEKMLDSRDTNKKSFKCKNKLPKIVIFAFILLLAAGYLVYINLPNITINVANAQAGIKANYPDYCPDGYSLSGSITYSSGQVTIDYRSNSADKKYSIKQEKSSWDSGAVKNKVNIDSKGEFITTEEGGLTIYSYNGNAVWVNGGILYTITGDASLTCDQIRRIASSL